MKSTWLMFKIRNLIYLSKANLHMNILFGKITHLLDSETRKMLLRVSYCHENSMFESGHYLPAIEM